MSSAEDEVGTGQEEEEEEESRKREPEKRLDPRRPSDAEVKEHEFTHVPFRNWCRHCVRGQGVE